MSSKVVCVSGFFDPLHYGHVDALQKAKALANQQSDGCEGTLFVLVNNDAQAKLKKGKVFMPCAERCKMVRSLGCVDAVMEAPDTDRTVCRAIQAVHPDIFAIGLDLGEEYMKEERELCQQMGVQVVCPLGERIQSSSSLIAAAAAAVPKKA